MTFTYNLSGTGDTLAVAEIRLEIGDTSSATDGGVKADGSNFTDDELLHFYTDEGSNVRLAAARACEVLARIWAGAGQDVRIRDYSIDTTQRATHYRQLAAELRSRGQRGLVTLTRTDAYTGSLTEYT